MLLLLSGCAADKTSPTPTATVAPSFTETTPLVIRPPRFPVNNLAWSPDGILQVWETATGRLISAYDDRDRSMKISILGWSADGKRITSTILGPGTTVQVWDADTGNTLVTFSHSYPVAISHDGKLVAVGSGASVQIWETSTGKQIATFDTAADHVDQLAWSPDGSLLATTNTQQTANDATNYTIQVWRAATGQHISTYRPPARNALYALTWSPDSKRIASAGADGTLQIW